MTTIKRPAIVFNLIAAVLLLFPLVASSAAIAADNPATGDSPVVFIDPGHGGSDPGATYYWLHEAEICLDVSLRLEEYLNSHGVETIMSRRADETIALSSRARMANQADADIFVSIHANASPNSSAKGTETYHLPGASEDGRLAGLIQEEMMAGTMEREDRGVKSAGFYVLRQANMPAALVEIAFVTNPDEAELMKSASYRQETAEEIGDGILRHLGVEKTDE